MPCLTSAIGFTITTSIECVQNEEWAVLPYKKKHAMTQLTSSMAMKTLRFDEFSSVRSLTHEGKIYFSSRDVCAALGYENISQALKKNCFPSYIVEMKDIASNPVDIQMESPTDVGAQGSLQPWVRFPYAQNNASNAVDIQMESPTDVGGEGALQRSNRLREKWLQEPAVYQLISKSKRPEAVDFQKWFFEEVLPSLRKNGFYTSTSTRNHQLHVLNETDLHHKLVEFIRSRYPGNLIIAGLGENQITPSMRLDSYRKGYTKGQPDIMLPVRSGRKVGLALELKSPGWQGEASENQKIFLDKLQAEGWEVCVSNCYEDLLFVVRDYMEKATKKRKRT
jgi:prophage antirepressor-like protein